MRRGNLRRQNEKAHLIGHVKDVGIDSKHQNPATRIYLTSVAQPWHVDCTDIVGECLAGMHTVGGAASGCSQTPEPPRISTFGWESPPSPLCTFSP